MKTGKVMAGIAAILAVSMVGGTWAVWTQSLIAKNEYKTAKYSTFLREKFESPNAWLPGEKEEKAVWVENQGTIPIIAKVTMMQNWERTGDVTATWIEQTDDDNIQVHENEIVAEKGQILSNTFLADENTDSYQYAALWNLNKSPGYEVMILKDKRADDPGLRMQGITEISTIEEAAGHWLMLDENPDQLGRYTFYYIGEVAPNDRTPNLLESVTMNPLLEATVTDTKIYYEKLEDGSYKQVTENIVKSYNGIPGGYDNCRYTLSVTMDTVQATPSGIRASNAFQDEIGTFLAGYVKGLGYDGSEIPGIKQMTITKDSRNRLSYTPTRLVDGENHPDEGNWFMSFTNMVPGEVYTDTLKIKNDSSSHFNVYMRIIPKSDEELDSDPETAEVKKELLEHIFMEVYYLNEDSAKRLENNDENTDPLKGVLLYQGTATGVLNESDADYDTLRDLIPLGYYSANEEGTIYVRLTLDPEIGLETADIGEYLSEPTYKYADLLTKVDWEFLIQQNQKTTGGGSGPGPGSDPGPNTPETTQTTITTQDQPDPNELVEIPDEDSPLANFDGDPRSMYIPDAETPLGVLFPKTGDSVPIIPIAVTCVVSLGYLMIFVIKKKKERE